MMITYDLTADIRLGEFGIEVPLDDDRAVNILKAIGQNIALSDLSHEKVYIDPKDLLRVHQKKYVALLKNNPTHTLEMAFELEHNINDLTGLYHRILRQVNGLYLSAKYAVKKHDMVYFLGGGMHHAMSDGGHGFCLVNDIVIAIRKLQHEEIIKTAWVIDTDAHKGDGTAQITAGDDSIITLSIHMKNGWPLDAATNSPKSFTPSKIDIPIEEGGEHFYLERLQKGLLELDKNFLPPDLCIVVAGSDPWEADKLPSSSLLKLEKPELLMRDKMVYEFLKARDIPQTWCFAGGYGERAFEIPLQFLKLF